LQLSTAARRQFLREHDALRHFEARQSLGDQCADLVLGYDGAGPDDDRGGDVLAQRGMRYREGHCPSHVGMAHQDLIDLCRGDLRTAAVDDFLEAAGEEQVAVGVEITLVARAKPSVTKGRLVGRGIVHIAFCHAGTSDHDLTTVAGRK
jgi:hypothetical protein